MLSSFLSQIASAQSLEALEIIRYGLDGFETLYVRGVLSYANYLTISDVYVQRYYILAVTPPTQNNPTLVSSYINRINTATTLGSLDNVRFGTDGFETIYSKGQLSYSDYLSISDVYVQRYSVLASPGTIPIIPPIVTPKSENSWLWWAVGGVAVIAIIIKKKRGK